jgi:uncharacterized protein YqeY
MGIRQQLMDDLREAMLQRDDLRKTTVRSVMAAIKKAETELDADGKRVVLDEDDILVIVGKQAKQRQESITEYRKADRQDLAAQEEAELAILKTYLPQEIEAEARQVISEVGAEGPRDIGKVMRPLMARFKGRADGRLVNQVVMELLAG